MADLKTTLCGMELESPFVLGSGPLGFDAESLIEATAWGAGAVVTKSIAAEPFVNTTQHMAMNGPLALINNELGSDLPLKQWTSTEIPKAKDGGVKVLIASVYGYESDDEAIYVAKECERAGADMIEIVSGYLEAGKLSGLIRSLKSSVSIPVIAKVNANWTNTDDVAYACSEAGADAITAIDSMGPAYRLNLATAQPVLGGSGYGWVSGSRILPFALRYVHDIALKSTVDIIGTGGITTPKDALEMLLAGASCCGVCSLPIIRGASVFKTLNEGLAKLLDQYGYGSVKHASRRSLQADTLPERSIADFRFNAETCTRCMKCVTVCPYKARTLAGDENTVDGDACRICGLCFDACPNGSISIM